MRHSSDAEGAGDSMQPPWGESVKTAQLEVRNISERGFASVKLPPRSLERARGRLAVMAVAVAVVATLFRPVVALELFGFENAQVNAELTILVLLGLCLDASMFLVAKNPRISHHAALNFGLLYEVLRSFSVGLNMVRIEGLAGLTPSALTFAFGGLLLFPLIIPMRRTKAFLVSLLAAATQPLALAVFSPVPVPRPILVLSLMASAATVAFAVLCGRLGYALTARAARGRELGSYHLEKLLRRDDTGELWQATHRLLARPTAVKTIRPWLMDAAACDQALQRFAQEAQVAAALTSPHTLTLYDYGVSEDGAMYCALELVEGESLFSLVARDGPISLERAKRLALEVCDSVQEAHAIGLLHRALTPDHVFSCRVGRRLDYTKVAGFGRVRFEEAGNVPEKLSSSDSFSTIFPPPEVAAGAAATERSDIYQLGGLVFFALSGYLPWGAALAATHAVVHDRPGAATSLLDVVARCLAEDPAARFGSMAELRAALESIEVGGVFPVPSRTMTARPAVADVPVVKAPVPDEHPSERLFTVASRLGKSQEQAGSTREPPAVSAETLDVTRQRLAQLGVLSAAFSVLGLILVLVSEQYVGGHGLAMMGSTVLGVTLDLALYGVASSRRWSSRFVFRAALGYFMLRCTLVAYTGVETYMMLGLPPPRITYAAVVVMLLPAFVPGKARALFIPSLLTVLGYSVILVRMQAPGDHAAVAIVATYAGLALMSSMFTARIMSGLHAAASVTTSYGGYRLRTRIGRGAMGEVWSAEHELLARPAAVKLIRSSDLTDEGAEVSRGRFEHEAYVTALLTSPHTVTLYDYGIEEDQSYYYVMELLEGEDLERHVARHGPLLPEQATWIALQLCDSLAEAHARGLVHRDLKPANLFLARAGCRDDFVKVLDFGVAELARRLKRPEDTSDVTDAPMAGTPLYMAPEVFLEEAIDARSDLYQVGCILFFLMTGHVPFDRPNVAALGVAHIRERPPSLADSSPYAIPDQLARIVARCMAKKPRDRYASAEDLEADLKVVFEGYGMSVEDTQPLARSGADPWYSAH